MTMFPKIQSPCPYKGKFADIMQGNQCRLCKREVVDLTQMASAQRKEFLSACDTEVCVSYRVGAKSALAAMAMSTIAVPTAASAQSAQAGLGAQAGADPAAETQAAGEAEEHPELMWIIVGGMRKPGDAEWVEDTPLKAKGKAGTLDDLAAPEPAQNSAQAPQKPALPVEYDDELDTAPDTPDETVPAR